MTREEIATFEKTIEQLHSFHEEIAVLVKKDPKAEMNTFKLRLINSVLLRANEILGIMKPFDNFCQFEPEEIPNNGDVVMILGQYINCLEELKKNNVHPHSKYWYWNIDGKTDVNEIRTYIPEKYRR